MSNSDFQILREVYRFLAEFEPDAIAAAGRRQHTSENLKIALDALAREARQASVKASGQNRKTSVPKSGPPSNGATPATSPAEHRQNLTRFLLDPTRFPDKNSLTRFAEKIDIPLAADPKSSRERLVLRIVNFALANESVRRRLDSITAKAGDAGDAQTKGWLDLILGAR